MPRFEVRFYDPVNRVKLALELDAPDMPGAEEASWRYLGDLVPLVRYEEPLHLLAVRAVS